MKVRFPDASERTLSAVRATHRLERFTGRWRGAGFTVSPDSWQGKPMLRVTWPSDKPEIYACVWLRHMGDGEGYAGGCWVDAIPTGFTARQDGDVVVLEIWNVEPSPRGPDYVEGLDGA